MAESSLCLNKAIFANKNAVIETIIRSQMYVIISILFLLKKKNDLFPIKYLRYVRKVVKYI